MPVERMFKYRVDGDLMVPGRWGLQVGRRLSDRRGKEEAILSQRVWSRHHPAPGQQGRQTHFSPLGKELTEEKTSWSTKEVRRKKGAD
jgi:hypothetical protein